MFRKFLKLIENDTKFNIIWFSTLILAVILFNFSSLLGLIFTYLFGILFYTKKIQSSINSSNTIFKQIIWLLISPLLIVLLPMAILEIFIHGLIYKKYLFNTLYILFFIATWVLAVFIFELEKIKVAVQGTNAFFITILSLTFIFNYTSNEIIEVLKLQGLTASDIATQIDLFLKTITIPYILAGIWATVAIAIREYRLKAK
jgi:hypothetical protein